MRLGELLQGVDVAGVDGGGAGADAAMSLEIGEVRDDSRAVVRGDLFVATRGQTVDGHDFLGAAAERGAVAAIVEDGAAQGFPGVRVRVRGATRALALIAANRWGRPADAMTMIAVTGTNGKTTTTFLVEGLARAAGGRPGVIGTVTYRFGDVVRESPFTTPTPLVLHATLAEMRAAGVTHVAMEASSHALELRRLDGVRYRVAAFTNLTQDHLDFHGTMQAYADSKAKLFREHLTDDGVGVINLDNEWGGFMLQEVRGRALAVATSGVPDVLVMRSTQTVDGIDAELVTPIGAVRVRSPLIGAFNLENLAIGVGIGVAMGLDGETIARGLGGVRGVPGRVERVENDRGIGVFVDYAHTPDALERVMAALRPLVRGRLIVVFGCGGDRDKTKRPKMGRAVAHDADLAIVTSDNPRTEEPGAIIDMILDGVREVRADGFLVDADRRRAIGMAIEAARAGDIVLIAGKGHEDYQIVGKVKHHFDDREEARAALAKVASRDANGQS
ncbi:MAG TPA: UDP-N-acetylmuramoyl-L-alanyl-D-glutamate--2,6-diaminopimelate ligase [Polyangia bacterium]|nr:UDP-N-acetylmuramoyl-L-alanyl-D-glutamate--2,6-diaminopimelate ligase [Polyangia bacterium]